MNRLFLFLSLICFSFSTKSQTVHKEIDSINNLYIQGLNISQDSLIKLYQSNLKSAKKISYKAGVAVALSKLSIVYNYQGQYEKSLSFALDAINRYEQLKMYDKMANQYAELGYSMKYRNLPKALKYMQEGKSIAEKYNLENELKNIYNNYGVLKEIENDLDSALNYYNKGLVIKKKQNDILGIPYSLSNIAGIYGTQKKYNKARDYFNESLQTRLKHNDSIGIAENYTQLSEVYFAEEDFKSAILFIHKSLPISIKKSYKNLRQYNYKLLSDSYKKLNNVDSALYYFEKYVDVKDSIQSTEVKANIDALTVEFETAKKEKKILKQRVNIVENEIKIKQKNIQLIGLIILILVLFAFGYLLNKQQKLKTLRLKKESELKEALIEIETQNKLQNQRLRISRDLHDNIGAQLTFIISTIENLQFGFKIENQKLLDKLINISNFTKDTIGELRDTIWAMNLEKISIDDLQSRISNYIEKGHIIDGSLKFSFHIKTNVNLETTLTSVEGMNIYRIIQESINNAFKYASATNIKVVFGNKNNQLHVLISDDGKGFDLNNAELGNGILNMRKRAEEIKATIKISSKLGSGTKVCLIK